MRIRVRAFICVALFTPSALTTLSACSAAAASKSGVSVQEVSNEIDSLDARFNRWVVAGQIDSIIGVYYAPDAVLLVAGSPPKRGSDQIRAVYESFYKLGTVRGKIQRSTLVTADSVATDLGHYDLQIVAKSDTATVIVADRGSYITSFVRRNGQWKAIYDGNVSEVPAPPPTKNAARE